MPGKRLLIGVGQPDLAGGGGRLLFLEPQGAFRQAEMAPADGDGAGRDDQHLLAGRLQCRDIVGQGIQPVAPDLAARFVHQQGGADLDDDPFGRIETGTLYQLCAVGTHTGDQPAPLSPVPSGAFVRLAASAAA